MKFKVGDIVRCKDNINSYVIPNSLTDCIVTEVIGIEMKVRPRHLESSYLVYCEDFHLEETAPSQLKQSISGYRYNKNKLRWRNVPMFLLRPVVEVGAAAEKIDGNPTGKYPTYNYLQGLSVADCMDCLKRHLDAADDPNQPDIDPEDGKHHLAKVAWNALVALHYINTRPDLDDRFKGENND